jgi:pimeloyl-ACP methyl ester carboxylesterase
MNVAATAVPLIELMERLGFDRYLVRGLDISAGVAVQSALRAPDAVAGLHLTGVSPDIDLDHVPHDLTPAERRMVDGIRAFRADESGYAHQQSTRPQSLAVGINDSPAGLAAWLVEKYRAWSDCGGDVETRFSKDELLMRLTIYWGHPDDRVVDQALLREPPPSADVEPGAGARGRGRAGRRRLPDAARVVRAPGPAGPVHRAAPRRPLRRARGARAPGRRPPRLPPPTRLGVALNAKAPPRGPAGMITQ